LQSQGLSSAQRVGPACGMMTEDLSAPVEFGHTR
jgi:hypothetical protein